MYFLHSLILLSLSRPLSLSPLPSRLLSVDLVAHRQRVGPLGKGRPGERWTLANIFYETCPNSMIIMIILLTFHPLVCYYDYYYESNEAR